MLFAELWARLPRYPKPAGMHGWSLPRPAKMDIARRLCAFRLPPNHEVAPSCPPSADAARKPGLPSMRYPWARAPHDHAAAGLHVPMVEQSISQRCPAFGHSRMMRPAAREDPRATCLAAGQHRGRHVHRRPPWPRILAVPRPTCPPAGRTFLVGLYTASHVGRPST